MYNLNIVITINIILCIILFRYTHCLQITFKYFLLRKSWQNRYFKQVFLKGPLKYFPSRFFRSQTDIAYTDSVQECKIL